MNHDTLTKNGYRPGQITPNLKKKASKEHQKLIAAYSELSGQRNNKEFEDRVLKRVAELVYIIRSNIAHGEKTPYGPDLEKAKRDEEVCTSIVPIQFILFDMLLGCPNEKFFIYGTLAANKPNHMILSDLEGSWERCTTTGEVAEVDNLPALRWDPSDSNIVDGWLFASPDLGQHWERLDRFEGESYERRLILVKSEAGISVANAYQGA